MTPRRALREHLAPVRAPSWDAVERAITRRRRARVAALALAPACALALLVLARRPAPPSAHNAARSPELVAVGAELREGTTVLSDRSRIDVARGAALRLVSRDERAYVFALLSGTVSFEVNPGGPRRWRVDAGLATVTVVGTGFTVARAPDRVRVSVRHGAVRVESALLAEGSALLRDGASLDLRAPPDAAPRVGQAIAHDAGVSRARRAVLRRAVTRDAGATSASLPPRDAGETSPPIATNEAVEALWSRADVLRRARAFAASCALLEEIATTHPTSPRRRRKTCTLGICWRKPSDW